MWRIFFFAGCILAIAGLQGEAFAQTVSGACSPLDPHCQDSPGLKISPIPGANAQRGAALLHGNTATQTPSTACDALDPRCYKALPPLQERWVAGVPMLPLSKGASVPAEDLYAEAAKSVLLVHAEFMTPEGARPWREQAAIGQGSAVAVSPTVAITNCHVVMTGDENSNDPAKAYANDAADILVQTNSGATAHAQVYDRFSDIDICFIHVSGLALVPVKGIRPFDALKVGEKAAAIGNPKGLTFSYTEGVISSIRPRAGIPNGAIADVIQFSAPIEPGSSGGALFDASGNLIGITESMLSKTQGFNFAVAADLAWRRYGKVCDSSSEGFARALGGIVQSMANLNDCKQGIAKTSQER